MTILDLLTSAKCIIKTYDDTIKLLCEKCGMSSLSVKIISFLHNNPNFNTINQIAEIRMLSKGNVSVVVDELERDGYLKKEQDKKDKRKINLYLTSKANIITDKIDVEWANFVKEIYQGFSDEDRDTYKRLRERLVNNAKKMMADNQER